MITLTGATLIDGSGGYPIRDATVVLDGERIASAGPGADAVTPPGSEVINCAGMTILPGLVDLHAHLCWAPNLVEPNAALRDDPYVPESYLVLWGAAHARALLNAGFTTVRDGFAYAGHSTSLALRDAIRHGAVPGPRIVAAGYAGATGTEVDMRMAPYVPRPESYTSDGPWALRRRVRQCAREGYEWIKTFTSGGRVAGAQEEDIWYVNHTLPEMEAIVDEAHQFGMGVMVHATTRDAIKLALVAGADTIEHGWPLDKELIDLFGERDATLVPTISVYSNRGFNRDEVETALKNRARHQFENRMNSFRRAYEAGVRIAVGTDVMPSMPTMRPGDSAFELAFMVEQGMTPSDAIASATSVAAKVLGMTDSIGTVRPGLFADVIVVDGDPLADISVLETGLRLVFKGGVCVVRRDGATPAEAARPDVLAAIG
jgi:imidazolonepropionase-like amidohydrolase